MSLGSRLIKGSLVPVTGMRVLSPSRLVSFIDSVPVSLCSQVTFPGDRMCDPDRSGWLCSGSSEGQTRPRGEGQPRPWDSELVCGLLHPSLLLQEPPENGRRAGLVWFHQRSGFDSREFKSAG